MPAFAGPPRRRPSRPHPENNPPCRPVSAKRRPCPACRTSRPRARPADDPSRRQTQQRNPSPANTTMPRDNTILRNIGIAAHIDAGKTTVSERILFYTGQIHKMGEVHEGTTTTDFDEEERKRGITIYSAAVSAPWLYEQDAGFLYKDAASKITESEDKKLGRMRKGIMHQINLIDTPGHVDFTAEVERSLRVLDGAIAVFDGKEGVEAQSETVWRQATKYAVPRMCFINKMDKMGADFDFSFNSIHERLGAPAVAVQYPIGKGNEFKGMIDLVRGVEYHYKGEDKGTVAVETPISDDNRDLYEEWREKLLEACADIDDDVA